MPLFVMSLFLKINIIIIIICIYLYIYINIKKNIVYICQLIYIGSYEGLFTCKSSYLTVLVLWIPAILLPFITHLMLCIINSINYYSLQIYLSSFYIFAKTSAFIYIYIYMKNVRKQQRMNYVTLRRGC